MRKCESCGKERQAKKYLCDKCYSKEWRKNNPEKIKEYLERTKERRKKFGQDYYENNMDKTKEYHKEYGKTEAFKERRRAKSKTNLEKVRRQTRVKYPLEGQKCSKCNNPAKHRHHTTEPVEVDKFIFLCHGCHMKEHNKKSHGKHAVISEEKEK